VARVQVPFLQAWSSDPRSDSTLEAYASWTGRGSRFLAMRGMMAAMREPELEVREAESRLRAAMLANDVRALARLLHDDLVFTGPDGRAVGKQDDLDAHAARRLRLVRLDVEVMELHVRGVEARVRALARLEGTFDGAKCDGTYVYERTWRSTPAGWQIVAGGVRAEG
jgi:ketosteroid isomerase-like protein